MKSAGDPMHVFDTFTGEELLALDDVDLQQLDEIGNDPEKSAAWWAAKRDMWKSEREGA